MKVACIGNMNNNFFSLVRFLRDLGIDARLLVLENEIEHFGPACDTFDTAYTTFTDRLPWGDIRRYARVDGRAVSASVAGYDRIVACGSAPAFLEKAGRAVDVFAPYGTDFMDYPFLRLVQPRWIVSNWSFRLAQRRAIRRARALMFDHGSAELDRIVERLGYRGTRIPYAVPMLYTPAYAPAELQAHRQSSKHYSAFARIRSRHDVILFSSNRHIWTHPDEYNWDKGTERLLRGFAKFCHEQPAVRAALVLFEYGIDVADSKQLIAELGIGPSVFWFPTMERRELMLGLSLADIGVGELAHSFVAYGTAFESLALAKPLLAMRADESACAPYSRLYPVAHAGSVEEVAWVLGDFVKRPEHYREMGQAGRRWFQEFGVERPLDALLRELGRAAQPAAPGRLTLGRSA